MAEPYIGEIKMFAGNFNPRGYAYCSGQLLPISQNTALFSLLGTIYGGNGQTTFALPNLQGRAPMNWGQGSGLTNRVIGQNGGTAAVTLNTTQIPSHNHLLQGTTGDGTLGEPNGATFGSGARGNPPFYAAQGTSVPMAQQAIGIAGTGQPHNNLQPYLVVSFIIALTGVYPPRS